MLLLITHVTITPATAYPTAGKVIVDSPYPFFWLYNVYLKVCQLFFFSSFTVDVMDTFTKQRRHFRLTDFSPSPGLFWASVQNVGQCFDVKSSISPFFSNVGVHGFEWEMYDRQSTMTVALCSLLLETLNGLLGSRSRIEAQRGGGQRHVIYGTRKYVSILHFPITTFSFCQLIISTRSLLMVPYIYPGSRNSELGMMSHTS